MTNPDPFPGPTRAIDRRALRSQCLAARMAFAATPQFAAAQTALLAALRTLLDALEPDCLGLFWPVRGEFSAGVLPWSPAWPRNTSLALPFARRPSAEGAPAAMTYRLWDGPEAQGRDDYGLPTAQGAAVQPDVLLVPCVGYTDGLWRLGYGGGFFDRWLADHAAAGVTTVGIAWSGSRLDDAAFAAQPHDRPLDLILTERGVVGG